MKRRPVPDVVWLVVAIVLVLCFQIGLEIYYPPEHP